MKKLVFLIFTALAGIALTGCIKDNVPVTLVSIAVTSQPINKTYFVNESFNTAGMVVTATYNNDSTEPITITDSMLRYDFSTAGTDKTVTITYEDKSTTITDITVNPIIFELDVMVTGVYIYTGEPIEPSGTNVTVKADNVTLTEGNDYTLSYSDNTDIGTATVTAIGTGNYTGSNGMASFIIFPPFSGAGTSTEPYEIGTSAQLAKLAELVNAGNDNYIRQYYKLTADIDLSDYGEGWNNGKGWIPIGRGFFGYFDGDNHKVTGLYINDDNLDFAGLFGATFYGTVQNLNVDGKVVGRDFVGGLTGQVAYNGQIINCCVSGKVRGNDRVGGLAGSIEGYSFNVISCHTTNVVSGNEKVGGLVGSTSTGNITNSYATGMVSGNYSIGGVAGYVSSSIVQNCYATGTVSGNERVGGAVGNVAGSVYNCYATGKVSGNERVGGVAGGISNGSSVDYCYATGAVSSNGNYVGGIAGYVEGYGFVGIKSCVALNPNVTLTSGSAIGRVTVNGALDSNVAWNGMLVNGSIVTSNDGSSIHGADIDKFNAKTQLTYTDYHQFGLDWQFGNEGYNTWKMGIGDYPLPVFWWQTKEPAADITHLE